MPGRVFELEICLSKFCIQVQDYLFKICLNHWKKRVIFLCDDIIASHALSGFIELQK